MKKDTSEVILTICRINPEGVDEDTMMEQLEHFTLQERIIGINKLLAHCRLQLLQDDQGRNLYKEICRSTSNKLKNLTTEGMLIYNYITESGAVGISARHLQSKSNILGPQVFTILKDLESRLLVKSVRSTENGNPKVFLPYEVEPSNKLIGGAYCTEADLDLEFIQVLRATCLHLIKKRTSCSLKDLQWFVKNNNIAKVEMQNEDIFAILHTLILDGLIEIVGDENDDYDAFRLTRVLVPNKIPFTGIPCGMCPILRHCSPTGAISPATCVYYEKWLDF